MLTRRQVLIGGAVLACWPPGCARLFPGSGEALVNDIHSQLNATRVARVVRPASLEDVERVVRDRTPCSARRRLRPWPGPLEARS